MLSRIKKSRFGKAIHRASKHKVIGWPIRVFASLLKHERLQPSHFQAHNRAHNAEQQRILRSFTDRINP